MFLVDLDHDAAGISRHASTKGVASNQASSGHGGGDLKQQQFVSCVGAGGQGAQCCKPVPPLADGNWADYI
jgi:hypothetical protein